MDTGAAPTSSSSAGGLKEPEFTGPGWNMARRVAFRFAFVYFILYILPFPIEQLHALIVTFESYIKGDEEEPNPDPEQRPFLIKYALKPYEDFMDDAVLWTGKRIFDKNIEYRPAGSGDTTWNFVQLFMYAAVAAGVTLLWTLASGIWWKIKRRSRLGYPHLHEWLRVLVRFNLAYFMIVYGSMKVIKLQFSYPGPDTLLHTYGESSPMHLLWTFMGASDGYTWFTGAGEMLAGILLCTRRTMLLGSLVTFGVMVHVAALNFCYDVPVKLFSSHLVLMSLFLMAPDLLWMGKVFLLGQSATPRGYRPLVTKRWLNWALFVIRTIVVLTFIGTTMYDNYENSKLYGRRAPEPPLAGLWQVEEFSIDGTVRPPLTTDATRWQRLVIRRGFRFRKQDPAIPSMSATNMLGKFALFAQLEIDEDAKTLTLIQPNGPQGSGKEPIRQVLKYSEPEENVMILEGQLRLFADGKFGPKPIKVRLRHYGNDKFLLANRGFHWINEMPYNQFGPRTESPPELPPPPPRKE